MHEFGIVEGIVSKMLTESRAKGVEKIDAVHFRRGSAFCDASLHQAFKAVTAGTEAEGAKLTVDVVNLDHNCECGHQQVITSDDLEGHMFICPKCGAIREIDEAHDLELLGYYEDLSQADVAPAAH
jgi:Zn finger protein HypA/HybF involved in hydrogenase expression